MKSYVYNLILGLSKENQGDVSSSLLYSKSIRVKSTNDFLEILNELEQDGLIEIRELEIREHGLLPRGIKVLTPKEIVAKRQFDKPK